MIIITRSVEKNLIVLQDFLCVILLYLELLLFIHSISFCNLTLFRAVTFFLYIRSHSSVVKLYMSSLVSALERDVVIPLKCTWQHTCMKGSHWMADLRHLNAEHGKNYVDVSAKHALCMWYSCSACEGVLRVTEWVLAAWKSKQRVESANVSSPRPFIHRTVVCMTFHAWLGLGQVNRKILEGNVSKIACVRSCVAAPKMH